MPEKQGKEKKNISEYPVIEELLFSYSFFTAASESMARIP
jgi:hypothetical protein